jgi:hypothetical protein
VTVPRLLEIVAYWEKVPPLHEAFAGFIGATSKGTSVTPNADTSDDGGALVQDLMSLGFAIPPEVLG